MSTTSDGIGGTGFAPASPVAPSDGRVEQSLAAEVEAPVSYTVAAPSAAQAVSETSLKPVTVETKSTDYDAFAHAPPFRPRRNPAKLWTAAAVAVALLLAAIAAAVVWVGPARIASLIGLPGGSFDTPLLIMPRALEPRVQANGTILLPVSGRIVNPTDSAQPLLDILAEVRDAQGRVVYSWTIPRPAATVAARGSVAFESATVNPPKTAAKLKFVFIGTTR